jgi:hypothetical protein
MHCSAWHPNSHTKMSKHRRKVAKSKVFHCAGALISGADTFRAMKTTPEHT